MRLCATIGELCRSRRSKRVVCDVAGVIPAVLAAMSAHGCIHSQLAAEGLTTLNSLVCNNPVNSDAIVLSVCGLDVILSVTSAFPRNAMIQWYSCCLLSTITTLASPAAMSLLIASNAVDVIRAECQGHRAECSCSEGKIASEALARLTGGPMP